MTQPIPAGWYAAPGDAPGQQRWWDGTAWTDTVRATPNDAPPAAPYVPQPRRAVSKERKRTSHGLHLFLTIITGGAWGLFVWLPITFWHKMGPRKKTVTRYK